MLNFERVKPHFSASSQKGTSHLNGLSVKPDMQTEALQILYIQMTLLIGTESFTNCSKKDMKNDFWSSKSILSRGSWWWQVWLLHTQFTCLKKVSHVMSSLDNFCVKALYMKKQGTRWTLVIWTINLHLFSLHFLFLLPACCSPSMESIKSNSVRCFPFFWFPVSVLVSTGNYAWLWTEMLDRSFLMISLTSSRYIWSSSCGSCLMLTASVGGLPSS